MRLIVLVVAFACIFGCNACGHTNARAKTQTTNARELATPLAKSSTALNASAVVANSYAPARVDFSTQIKPILEAHCHPCHFSGGKVYPKMPFDRPETIKTLSTKLFTRIKDENERRLISAFLAQE